MIQISEIIQTNYSIIIDGNDSECELVISTTSRQDGKTSVAALSTDIDGNVEVFADPKLVGTVNLHMELRNIVARWIREGIAPTQDEADTEMAKFEDFLENGDGWGEPF